MKTTAFDFDRCYAAVSGRDRRFDGQFVVAVRSTGIYCRPSCPARTPLPAHCTFYPTSAAAHVAGYRACKRCLPEAVPGSPAWNVREDVAARAMRLIASGTVDRDGVAGLAADLGYSSRQLNRILHSELGAGPLALARAQRAHTARQLLVATDMRAADVAFAAGFTSVRQFNDTIGEVFGMTPTQVRASARRAERSAQDPVSADVDARSADAPTTSVTVRLPVRTPFDGAGLLEWFRPRVITGVEHVDQTAYTRSVRLAGGPGVVRLVPRDDHIEVTAHLTELSDLPQALAITRRICDADADPRAIDAALARDPALASTVARMPGIRLPGTADPFEMLVRALLGQQVTVAAARTAVQRLVDALASPLTPAFVTDRIHLTFPNASTVAARARDVVRGPARRTEALVTAAGAVADGTLRLDAGRTVDGLARDLEAIRGIGPWTSHYVALRVLNSPDLLLTGDVAARAGAVVLGLPADPRGLARAAEPHRPWRSYLMMHLWRAASPDRQGEP